MKKQIALYIGWDAAFILLIYVYSIINHQLKDYVEKTLNVYPSVWVPFGFFILMGGLITCLLQLEKHNQHSRKSAVLELLIIGIPAFYLATMYIISMIFSEAGISIHAYVPYWLWYSSTPMVMGGILFGYELFLFAVRMVRLKRSLRTNP